MTHGKDCTCATCAKTKVDAKAAYERPIPGEKGARKLVAEALRKK